MNRGGRLDVPEWYRFGVSTKASAAARAALAVPESPAEWLALSLREASKPDAMAAARAALYALIASGVIEPVGDRCRWVDQVEGERRRKARDAAYSARYRAQHGDATKAARDAKRREREKLDEAFAEKRRAQRREQKRRARARARGVVLPEGVGAPLQEAWGLRVPGSR